MERAVIAMLLFVCVGAVALTGEAARTHTSFAARTTYEETNESQVVPPKEEATTEFVEESTKEEKTTTVPDRYPGGYPNVQHRYNPETQKYETEEKVGIPEAGRYVHGYYNEATTKYSESDTLPTVKSSTSYYSTEDSKESKVDSATNVPNRYAAGYPKSLQTNYQQSSAQNLNTQPGPEGRYPHGYYGKATSYAENSYTGNVQHYTGVSYTTQSTVDPQVVGPEGRYPNGYFPNSQYAGGKPSVATSLTSSSTKPVSYSSYTGNFNTLPYPSVAPFVENGAGCRTAFWAENVEKWPSFFTAKSTVGDAFGAKATEVFAETTILQALLKYDSEPYNELLRSGCTALLNSYSRGAYPVAHMKVIEQFNTALTTKETAKAQALAFETANVESISSGNACV